jgi:gliding motility-associated-like protein
VKYLFSILCLFSLLYSEASHLLGGEITYKHKENKTYEIFVTLYRDCDDCKLGGTGGGTSTSNCSDLEQVYLRTISNVCGDQNIGTVALTKLGYTDITSICDSYNTRCETNANYAYGIEAHYYKGTVNFENYNNYLGCAIQIFFNKSERSGNITTLNTEEDNLYNYAIINPWEVQYNSPQFLDPPKIIFNHNQATYASDRIVGNDGDSIVYQWAIPQNGYKSNINYKAGYASNSFVTPYCSSGTGCTPNPNATIPEGIYLNPKDGSYVLTPTGSNEFGTRVLEAEQWRIINGSYKLIGKVRRDVVAIIKSTNNNNNPVINAADEYFACVNQALTFKISSSDIPKIVGGVQLPQDTVKYNVHHSVSGLMVSQIATSQAPFYELKFSITPTSSNIGEHIIYIEAKDNFCPEYGISKKAIRLVIKPEPQFNFSLNDEFCGNNRITLNSNRPGYYRVNLQSDSKLILDSAEIQDQGIIYHPTPEDLHYTITYTDYYGCSVVKQQSIANVGSAGVKDGNILGDTVYCSNESTYLFLNHSKFKIKDVIWERSGAVLAEADTLKVSPFTGAVDVLYKLENNNLLCEKQSSISILEHTIPNVEIEVDDEYCFNSKLDLSSIETTPTNGTWSSDVTVINNTYADLSASANQDQILSVTYSFVDNTTGCSNSASEQLSVIKAPEMTLSNEAICGDNFIYKLASAIELPFHPDVEDITWNILNRPDAYSATPYPSIDIPNYGTGTYVVEGINTYANGCVSKDTCNIIVDEGLVLTTNGKTTACESGDVIDLESYFGLNANGGGWSSFAAGEQLNTKFFTPSKCGKFDLTYTYDKYGCYDEIDIELDVICRPKFEFNLADSICENNATIPLESKGYWNGNGVNDYIFSPEDLSGVTYIRQVVPTNGCLFDTIYSITILEPLNVEFQDVPDKLCEGEVLDLELSTNDYSKIEISSCNGPLNVSDASFSYLPTICDLDRGLIWLDIKLTSTALCPASNSTLNIEYNPKPSVVLPEERNDCWPFSIHDELQIGNGNNTSISYTIEGSSNIYRGEGNVVQYTFPQPGLYNLIVETSDDNGCTNIQTVKNAYHVNYKPEASFEINTGDRVTLSNREIYLGNTSRIEQGDFNSNWFWEKNGNISVFSSNPNPIYELPADTGLFTIGLEVISEYNCVDSATRTILVVPDIIAFIPNAFTPDEKGPPENATFNITSSNVQDFHIQIYNKWGQMVFESFNIENSWDGKYLGRYCQNGVFVYSVKLTNHSGGKYSFQGTVNLIR